MLGCQVARGSVQGSDEFGVHPQVLEHSSMLSPDRAIYDLGTSSFGHGPTSSYCHRTVDHSHRGFKPTNITSRLADEVNDLVRVTHMKNVYISRHLNRIHIHTDCVVVPRNQLE